MNKLVYFFLGILVVIGCGATNELLWHTGFIVPSHGLGHECNNGPLDWSGGQGDCFFAGSLSNEANSASQKLSFLSCPPGPGCNPNGHSKASIYEDPNGNLIIQLPPGGTVQVVH